MKTFEEAKRQVKKLIDHAAMNMELPNDSVFDEKITALLEAYEADRLEKILLFADWISKGMWTRHEHTDKLEDVGKWYNTYRYSVMEEPLTTKELYELFESEVPKPFKPE
jgi:hypothetical protein